MEKYLLKFVLPEIVTSHFTITAVQELGDISSKTMFLDIYLEEKNQLPEGLDSSLYESKGFSSSSRIQDFSIRGKAVFLNIKRRRWRHKQTNHQVTKDLSIVSAGSRISK